MSVKLVILIIGIIFYIVRNVTKNKENQPNTPGSNRPKPVARKAAKQNKSIDDIFNEFVKEVENSKKKQAQPVLASKRIERPKPKQSLDWQQVDRSNIKAKEQLIDHEDYHGISHRVDEAHQIEDISEMSIESSEGELYEFDINKVDWRRAIITKEILDRKYT